MSDVEPSAVGETRPPDATHAAPSSEPTGTAPSPETTATAPAETTDAAPPSETTDAAPSPETTDTAPPSEPTGTEPTPDATETWPTAPTTEAAPAADTAEPAQPLDPAEPVQPPQPTEPVSTDIGQTSASAESAEASEPEQPHEGTEPVEAAPGAEPGESGTAAEPQEPGAAAVASPSEVMALHRAPWETVAADIEALVERINGNAIAAKEANSRIESLRAAVAALPAAPEALTSALAGAEAVLAEHLAALRAARAAASAAARETKSRIVLEAEEIAQSDQWRVGSERLPVLLEEWKACARLDRKSDDDLWKRFSSARSLFAKRRKAHYSELNAGRTVARNVKEELVARAERLASSTDWTGTAGAYRSMMAEWKAAGRAGREIDDELWARFRAAQDLFFANRNDALGARDAEQSNNVAAKEELLAEAERLIPVTDPRSARAALRSIVDRWNAVGPVPSGARSGLEARLAAVENAVRAATEPSSTGRSSPARARAEETVAALRASIATLETKGERARAAGDAKRAAEAAEAVAARREWLAEAERTLAALS